MCTSLRHWFTFSCHSKFEVFGLVAFVYYSARVISSDEIECSIRLMFLSTTQQCFIGMVWTCNQCYVHVLRSLMLRVRTSFPISWDVTDPPLHAPMFTLMSFECVPVHSPRLPLRRAILSGQMSFRSASLLGKIWVWLAHLAKFSFLLLKKIRIFLILSLLADWCFCLSYRGPAGSKVKLLAILAHSFLVKMLLRTNLWSLRP